MRVTTENCQVCLGLGVMTDWNAGSKIRKQCEDCIPASTLEDIKDDCARYAKAHYAKHRCSIAALDECYEQVGFKDLSNDEIFQIVENAIEEWKEKESGIYNQ